MEPMKLLLATNHLGLGGSESYLLTVAEQLDRLGHEAVLYSPEGGPGSAVAEERAIPVVTGELPEQFDAALVQDGGVSLQIADRRPDAPQLFVCHSGIFNLQAPPQLETVDVAVALNERIAERLRHYAAEVEVVRLRQPIDTERFFPREALSEVPRKALLLSNTPNADRLLMIEAACAEAGIELESLGGRSGQTTDTRAAVAGAEIVIGYGRSALEAMACGRAAYVYDWNGGDGWVTKESYPAIEAGGFAGRSGSGVIDQQTLAEDLSHYSPEMGPVNHDLVVAHHGAGPHAIELVRIFDRLEVKGTRPQGPLQEMARLVRLEWRARSETHALSHENAHLRGLLTEADQGARQATAALEAEREHSIAVVRGYEETTSWRFTRPFRWAGSALRRVRNRG
jgi:hypothetical protein